MNFFKRHKNLSVWVTAFLFIAVVLVLQKSLDRIGIIFDGILNLISILSPFIIGFIIAFVLLKPCEKLESWFSKRRLKFLNNHKRGLSILITCIAFVGVLGLCLYYIIPKIFSSVVDLFNSYDTYYDKIMALVHSRVGEDGKFLTFEVSQISEFLKKENILTHFNVNVSDIAKYATGAISVGATVLINVFIAFIAAIYMLGSREFFIHGIGHILSLFMKKKSVGKVHKYFSKIGNIFNNYIYSQLLDASILACVLAIAFTIIGVPYGFLWAIIIGISNLIPYFGAIVSGLGVAMFTAIGEGMTKGLITIAVILVVQQLDGNILQPRIVGKSVGVHPIFILVSLAIGGALFGFVGMLIGAPIMAVLKMILDDILEIHDKKERKKAAVLKSRYSDEIKKDIDQDF